jgi:hypothetical protein
MYSVYVLIAGFRDDTSIGRAFTYLYTFDPYERFLLGQGCVNMCLEFLLQDRVSKQPHERRSVDPRFIESGGLRFSPIAFQS